MEKLKNNYKDICEKFFSQQNSIHRLWNVGVETAELLSFLVYIKKPNIVLELGTSNGFSTFHLALDKKTKIITVDVEKARQDIARENLKTFENIEFISERIEDYMPKISYQIDFLFIDSNKSNYLNYLHALETHLSDNSIVIADNIDSHYENTKKYQDYVKKSLKYKTIHLNIDSGLMLSIFNKE